MQDSEIVLNFAKSFGKTEGKRKENIERIAIDEVVQEKGSSEGTPEDETALSNYLQAFKQESAPGPSTLVTVRKQQLLKKKKNKITTTKSLILAQDER